MQDMRQGRAPGFRGLGGRMAGAAQAAQQFVNATCVQMQVEERFGLKRRHTYDEIVAWLNSDPKGVPYPNRVAFQTYNSHV